MSAQLSFASSNPLNHNGRRMTVALSALGMQLLVDRCEICGELHAFQRA